jgi:hypothetical protein
MSWADGSALMSIICTQSRDSISVSNYKDLIDAFIEYECDTLNQCLGICDNFDQAYDEYTRI